MSRLLPLLCLAWLVPAGAAAQLPVPPPNPSAVDVDAAREEFVRGMEHAQQSRWRPALERFLASYGLSGSPAALYNVASTLRSLDRPRAALEAVERLLEDPTLDSGSRGRAEELRDEVQVLVATLIVRGLPSGQATVMADGTARTPTHDRPLEIRLDPGLRVVTVEVPPRARFEWTDEISPGARVEVDANLLGADAPGASASFGGGEDLTPLAVGLGVGGAVLLALIVTLVVLDADAQIAPRAGLVITLP